MVDSRDPNDPDEITLPEAVADALDEVEADELRTNLSIRDSHLAALLEALERTDRLEPLGEVTAEELGQDEAPASRSSLLSALVRAGLETSAPEVLEEAREGYKEHLLRTAEDF